MFSVSMLTSILLTNHHRQHERLLHGVCQDQQRAMHQFPKCYLLNSELPLYIYIYICTTLYNVMSNSLHFNIFLTVAGLTDFNALSMIFTSSGTLAP